MRTVRKGFIFIYLAVLTALLAQPALAVQTGILAGTVTDLDGNGIGNAKVTLYRGTNPLAVEKNPQTTISDGSAGQVGHYSFKDLQAGRYRLVIEKSAGYGQVYTAEQQVTVSAGTVIQDIVLDIPEPTPLPVEHSDSTYSPEADGFAFVLAALALVGAVLLLRPPRWRGM